MKPRTLISLFTLALAASTGACAADSSQAGGAGESTAKTDQAQVIAATGNIMAWPAGPVVWDGLNGTWPISVWSPAAIGGLAFDVAGLTNLGVTCAGSSSIVASTISTPWLNAFVPPVGAVGVTPATPFFGPAGLNAPAFGFGGTFAPWTGAGFGFGAFAQGAAVQATFANGAVTPGFASSWFTPTLTSSALLFTGLTPLTTLMPFTFNVTFAAQSAAQAAAITQASAVSTATALQTAGLSIFATPIAAADLTATIPFTSMVFPVLLPLPGLAAAPIAPVVAAPVAAPVAF